MAPFKLPETKLCVVVWYRNGQRNETLINTPRNLLALRDEMLKFKVGASEIRAVKAVEASNLAASMMGV